MAQQIPGFQLISLLGKGAMARVYQAKQISLDRVVAIKVLDKKLSADKDYVRRFEQEGKAAAKLNHNNIVQAIDVGDADGFHYFVMEFVEGHTVFDELDQGKVYSESEALKIVIQIAKALVHAHDRGFMHRDVKPKNIMITPQGVAKLADMGLARKAEDTELAKAEQGRAYGTPFYIAPEQIRGQLDIDFRADIYGLGATFYHMVTGRVPFDAPTPSAVMHRHLRDPLVPPDHINKTLSVGVGEVIEVMMAKDPDQRYANTKDLLEDLESLSRGEPPMQVRKRVDEAALAEISQVEDEPQDPSDDGSAAALKTWRILAMIFAAALGVSVLLNIIQLLR